MTLPIDHLLTDTLTRASVTGRSGGGDPTLGAQSTFKARYEEDRRLMRDEQGNEIEVKAKLTTITDLARTDRIWIPGADTSKASEADRVKVLRKASTPAGDLLVEAWL